MQSDKATFKKEFEARLVALAVTGVALGEQLRTNRQYVLADQFVRSVTSIGANVHEAKSAHSTKDYIKYFEIALKSANETEYWLQVIDAATDISSVAPIQDEVTQVSKIIASSVLTLKKSL